MIGYFPKPYKNELFYSILARYHSHSSNMHGTETLRELTGKVYKTSLEFPRGLEYLVEELKIFSPKYDKAYFINNHTNIPLTRTFRPEKWNGDISFNNYKVSNLFGSKINDVKEKESLFYCSECLKEQVEIYGECYWNRLHQIPGVYVCTKHHVLLDYSLISLTNIKDLMLILPTVKDIKEKNEIYEKGVMNALINLAKDVEYLMDKNFNLLKPELFYQKYLTILEIKGIAYPILKRKEKVEMLIKDYYPIKFLELLNCSLPENEKTLWVPTFNGNSEILSLHPIKHLLLIRLLFGSAIEFFEKEYTYEPFGKGPWICMNPLAEHYLKKVVKKVEISIHHRYREIQGDMICSCGFVYRLRSWEESPLDIKYFSNRIMKKGYVWEREFDKLIYNKTPIKEIAKITNLSIPTIKKVLKDSQQLKVLNENVDEKIELKTKEYRKKWLELRCEYPAYHRNELSKINRAAYAWLRKYDKEWIEMNSPPKKSKIKKRNIDYLQKDLEYLEKTKKLDQGWGEFERNKKKIIRKTKNKIAILLGLHVYDKYPNTLEFVESIIENRSEFNRRRIKTLLENKYKYQIVTVNQIAEAAHVRMYIRHNEGGKELLEYIIENVKLHNKDV